MSHGCPRRREGKTPRSPLTLPPPPLPAPPSRQLQPACPPLPSAPSTDKQDPPAGSVVALPRPRAAIAYRGGTSQTVAAAVAAALLQTEAARQPAGQGPGGAGRGGWRRRRT